MQVKLTDENKTTKFEDFDKNAFKINSLRKRKITKKQLPRILSEPELYNSFLRVTDNFDIEVDQNAVHEAIEYRAGLLTNRIPKIASDHKFRPHPPSAKIMPINMRELEDHLNKNGRHCTFYTDNKLLKEMDLTSIRPKGSFHTTITQDEKLAYGDYFAKTKNPESFVNFLLKRRREETQSHRTKSLYGKFSPPNLTQTSLPTCHISPS